MADLVKHLEKFLGRIDGGWSVTPDGQKVPFAVARHCSPDRTIVPYSTLGLSRTAFRAPDDDAEVRHELVLLAPAGFGDRNIPAVLQQIGAEAIETGAPFFRGEVIGPRGTVFEGTDFTALYLTVPYLFPREFCRLQDDYGFEVKLAWAIPITEEEALFAKRWGSKRFEELMDEFEPDLADFTRPSLV